VVSGAHEVTLLTTHRLILAFQGRITYLQDLQSAQFLKQFCVRASSQGMSHVVQQELGKFLSCPMERDSNLRSREWSAETG
jgi:hypothetical protein